MDTQSAMLGPPEGDTTETAKVEDQERLDAMLKKMYDFRPADRYLSESCPLPEQDLWYITDRITKEFSQKPCLLEVDAPVTVCGDTHGQYRDLRRLFNKCGWPPRTKYLFLGDYVDRGPFSIETVTLMMLLRLRYPANFHILRGNHEMATINYVYGFYKDCNTRFNVNLWFQFQRAFDSLPVVGLVSTRIVCMHGGLSPELHGFDQLRKILLPFEVPETGGLMCDLLWCDPERGIKGYVPSNRGVSYKFGEDVVQEFCAKHTLDLVARAHQVVLDGIEFFADQKLVTVFSAPAYCGQFDNNAGMLCIDGNLTCRVAKVRPTRKRERSTSRSRG